MYCPPVRQDSFLGNDPMPHKLCTSLAVGIVVIFGLCECQALFSLFLSGSVFYSLQWMSLHVRFRLPLLTTQPASHMECSIPLVLLGSQFCLLHSAAELNFGYFFFFSSIFSIWVFFTSSISLLTLFFSHSSVFIISRSSIFFFCSKMSAR